MTLRWLMIRISGREPTAIDEQIFNLKQQMEALPSGASYDAQRAAFRQRSRSFANSKAPERRPVTNYCRIRR